MCDYDIKPLCCRHIPQGRWLPIDTGHVCLSKVPKYPVQAKQGGEGERTAILKHYPTPFSGLEWHPIHRNVAGLIPGPDRYRRQQIDVSHMGVPLSLSLSLSLSLFLSLVSKNKKIKKQVLNISLGED